MFRYLLICLVVLAPALHAAAQSSLPTGDNIVTGVGTSDDPPPVVQAPPKDDPQPPQWLVEAMPDPLTEQAAFGLAYWQWAGLSSPSSSAW